METLVRVKNGALRGVIEKTVYGEQFIAFRGIPYAKPPIGDLRFKDPQRPEPWTGIKDASKFGNVCAHFDVIKHEVIGSDDCLYLNVNTPSIKASQKLPVMVWIHGGAFAYGSGDDTLYGPDYLVRKDVVLVTFNYRLGVLGFLNLEHEVAPGNQGLKDMVLALKWVNENIANFGGDPDNITIFGESAGGAAVHYLTISPLAAGLFHKAIAQSGAAVNPWANATVEPKKYGFQLAANLGNETSEPMAVVDFLRTVDAQELVKAQERLIVKADRLKTYCGFGPGVDDKSSTPFLSEHPSIAMRAGVKVPFLLGYNQNEGSFLAHLLYYGKLEDTFSQINADLETIIPPSVLNSMNQEGITARDLKLLYFGDEDLTEERLQKYADFMGDVMFVRGIHDVLYVQSEKSRQPTYFYKFTYDKENTLMKQTYNVSLPGTTHGDDLFYLLCPHVLTELNLDPLEKGSMEYKVMEYFTEMWTNFARTGNPTPVETELITTIWKPIERGNVVHYLNINEKLEMESFEKGVQKFEWHKLKNKL